MQLRPPYIPMPKKGRALWLLLVLVLFWSGLARADLRIIRSVRITGNIHRSDGEAGLKRFLSINVGSPWDAQLQSRVLRDLEVLGYRADADLSSAGDLTLMVQTVRVVRRIFVSGNSPFFEFEILQNLTWRPGYRLPEGEFLVADLRKQESSILTHLRRNGYFDASVRIFLDWTKEAPDQIDVRVVVQLNAGFFRLRYNLGELEVPGLRAISRRELRAMFDHCCLWFGRTSQERIQDDMKRLVSEYHRRGYPGVRLGPKELRFDPERRQVSVKFSVEERKRFQIVFSGRKALKEKTLLEAITVFRDGYYSANELDDSARAIFRLYQQNGYFEARVSWRWQSRDSDPVVVEYTIHEGPQLRVRDVQFTTFPEGGNLAFSPSTLQDKILTKRYPRLGLIGLGAGGVATTNQLERDCARLEEFYRSQGYASARVFPEVARNKEALDVVSQLGLQAASDSSEETGDLYVAFRIEEGKKQTVSKVTFVVTTEKNLAPSLPQSRVQREIHLKVGAPYTPTEIVADIGRLERLYGTVGHPYRTIDPKLTWSADRSQVQVEYQIAEGPEVRFGEILLRGNFVTRSRLIRTFIPFRTGDLYNEQLLQQARQNLEQRQLFSYVKVSADPGKNSQYIRDAQEAGWVLRRNPVPVLVEVNERYDNSGEAALFVGISTDNLVVNASVPFYGAASYTWRNLFGTGTEAELRGELGARVQALVARLGSPSLWNPFWRLDLRAFWRNELTPALGTVNSLGGNIELTRLYSRVDEDGRRLPPTLRFFVRLDISRSQVLVPLWRTELTGGNTGGLTGDATELIKLSGGVIWDRRVGLEAPAYELRGERAPTNPLMSVKGFLLSLQATVAACCSPLQALGKASSGGVPGWYEGSFFTVGAQGMYLLPFGPTLKAEDGWPLGMKRFNFRGNARANLGIPFFGSALPVVERFYAGGDTAVRGYPTEQLKAEVVRSPIGALPGEPAYRLIAQGGNVRLLLSAELEFAITPKLLVDGWPWVGAIFVDVGAIADDITGIGRDDIRVSVGISLLRLLTRFGQLSLEYAYPITFPGQSNLLQNDNWKTANWVTHFPGRIHFNWGIPLL